MSIRYTAITALLATALLYGCRSTYFLVNDPDSGKKYYTTEVKRNAGASATFTDARTHTIVTLQNTQIMKITKDQYAAAVGNPAENP